MRVVGYLRAAAGVEGGRLYAQSEAVREWARRTNASVIALFQDDDGQVAGEGFQALARALNQDVDAVVVADRSVLSANVVEQEILRAHLQSRGIGVASADGSMESETDLPTRQVVRDVLVRKIQLDARLTGAPVVEPQQEGLVLEILPDVASG